MLHSVNKLTILIKSFISILYLNKAIKPKPALLINPAIKEAKLNKSLEYNPVNTILTMQCGIRPNKDVNKGCNEFLFNNNPAINSSPINSNK